MIICAMGFGAVAEKNDVLYEKCSILWAESCFDKLFLYAGFPYIGGTDLALQYLCYCFFSVVAGGSNVGCCILKRRPKLLLHEWKHSMGHLE